MEQTAQLITKDMVVAEVIEKYPFAAEVMEGYGLTCTGCHSSSFDSIESGARSHGISDDQIQAMVQELNEVVAKGGPPEPKAGEPLRVSERALEKMTEILAQQNKQGWGIRVQVSSGGCAGYRYGMDFAQEPGEADQVISAQGVRVFVDQPSAKLLSGVMIDYVESLQESGFKFENPKAKATCGCGQSFH